jgi:peptide/nickel transport system permease protein
MSSGNRYVVRRGAQGLVTVLLLIAVNFLIVHAAPGDIVDTLAGGSGSADPAVLKAMREHLGLDQSLYVQFLRHIGQLARLDLGNSQFSGDPVLTLLLTRLPATLLLMVPALLISFFLGTFLGLVASLKPRSIMDFLVSSLVLIGYATPLFWLGLMLIVVFTVKLAWLPSVGMMTIGLSQGFWASALDMFRHAVLPVITLSLFYLAAYARLTRATMIEVAQEKFVRAATAKGIARSRVVWRHIFRNALLPVFTMAGLNIGSMLGGALVVEVVFSWPGLGQLAFNAVLQRDNTLLLGLLFFSSIFVVVVNIVVDVLYIKLDPRIEFGGAS